MQKLDVTWHTVILPFDFPFQGYNTLITGDSVGMSRGQKRQIAIARALIRKPKLLLLDEATSALDTRSELAVREAIDRGSKGRTVVFATHRLADVRNADLIIMLERGRIKESGTHQQLLELDGLYAAMLRSQVMDLQQELHLSQ